MDWANSQGYLVATNSKPEPQIRYLRKKNHAAPGISYKRKRLSDKKIAAPHSLGAIEGDFINDLLKQELSDYKRYHLKNSAVREATVNKNSSFIMSTLGWLHRYRDFPLEKLSLNLIVPLIKLNLKLKDFKDEQRQPDMQRYLMAKVIARDEIKDIAKEVVQCMDNYIDFLNSAPTTQSLIVDAFINVAKYVYRDETDTEEAKNFDDIPIVQRLRKRRREIEELSKNTPPTISHELKSVTWEKALAALEEQRKDADQMHVQRRNSRGRPGVCRSKRPKSSVSLSLEKFLILGFMVLMPPDRSRTFQELEVGRTLVQGIFDGSAFMPKHRIQEPSQARWYIHLQPDDYKTGRIYGEWWGEVPNVQFADNKTFYDYIQRWWGDGSGEGERSIFNPNHNFFFTTPCGSPHTAHSFTSCVRRMMQRLTGMPVTPKEFRKMYVTYLKNIGASESELEAAATWMHHSREMQSKTYDQQCKQDKMLPITKLNQAIFAKMGIK